jgi:hypothetical protein
MKIIFSCFLVMTFSLYSQTNSILIIRPNESKFKKVELGIQKGLINTKTIKSIVSKTDSEILAEVNANPPKIAVIMGREQIKIWQTLQRKNQDLIRFQSLILESVVPIKNCETMSNSCIISYGIKLERYVEKALLLTGKKPLNIGIVYSEKSSELIPSYQEESNNLKVNLYAKPVVISDPENSIKVIVKNLIDHYRVDLIIILDDPAIIHSRNIISTWVPQLAPLRIPVAVPSDYFYELEPRIGSFAIQPHYSEIGHGIASLINEAEANNWIINRKINYPDKSICYFRNGDGSICRKDQIAYNTIASLPQKDGGAPSAHTPAQSEAKPDSQQNLAYNNSPHDNAWTNRLPASSSSGAMATDAPKEKRLAHATVNNPDAFNKKTSVPQSKATIAVAIINDRKIDVIEKVLQPTVLAQTQTSQQSPSDITTSSPDEKKIPFKENSSKPSAFIHLSFIVVVVAAILASIFLVVFFTVKRLRRVNTNKINCLLIAKRKKRIKQSTLNNRQISLDKYLKKFGLNIYKFKNFNTISNFILFNLPEIICVDWQINPNIQENTYEFLKEHMPSAYFILIFYNVVEPASVSSNGYFDDRTFIFNANFTASDLNKVLSMIIGQFSAQQQLAYQSTSCFEGKISDDTLMEFFQLMDINKKTGCLFVGNNAPFGMIFFEDGNITYAITNLHIAEKAVFEILSMKQGRFKFLPNKKPLRKQIQLNIVGVLITKAQLSDENSSKASDLQDNCLNTLRSSML